MDAKVRKTRLTEDEVAHYHENGFVVPDYRLPDDMLRRMRDAYDRLLEKNRGNPNLSPDFMLGPHLSVPGAQGVEGDPEFLEFAQFPEIVDMVSQVAGEDLILWGTTIFGKPARTGKATPWHQDGKYYPIEPLETTTVWIALDDADTENGCMRYIPGSHKQRRLFPHHWEERDDLTLKEVIDDEYLDEDKAYDLVLEAGQLSIHDVYMVHGSNPNPTDRRRVGFVLRIMPATSFYNHAKGQASENPSHDYSRRALYLLKGEDKTGRNDFTIGK